MSRFFSIFLVSLVLACSSHETRADVLPLPGGADRVDARHHIEVFEDREGALAIDDIRRLPEDRWVPRTAEARGDLALGYSSSAYWVRMRVVAKAAQDPWLLVVGSPTLDHVTLHGPLPGDAAEVSTGDLLPFAQRSLPHRLFVFPLALTPDTPTTYYLRLQSRGALTVPLTFWRQSAFFVQTQSSYLVLALYYGVLLALGIYSALLFLSMRDRVYLAYAAFVSALVVGYASRNGLSAQYLWPNAPYLANLAFPAGFAATGLCGAVLTRIVLQTRSVAMWTDRLLLATIAGFAVAIVLAGFGGYRLAAVLTSATGIAFSAAAATASWFALRNRMPGARWVFLAWTLWLAGVLLQALPNFGLLATSTRTADLVQCASAMCALMLGFALADRLVATDRDKKQAQAEMMEAKELLLRSLSESERRLEVRVHERTLDLALANRELEQARTALMRVAHYDQLTGLPNRTMLKDKLAVALARAQARRSRYAVLWMDLDGFKTINDAYGHLVGDKVLAHLSHRLQQLCDEQWLVVRFGGDEFIVVLENVDEPGLVISAADRLIAAVSEPMALDSGCFTVGASVGIAMFPDHGADGQTLLKRADQAMYRAKAAGGNSWHMAELEGMVAA